MLALKQFRDRAKGVPDLLPWAALIDDGMIINKDGSLLAGWFYRGPDVDSLTPEERNYFTRRLNDVLVRFDGGWAFWFESVRMEATGYPERAASHFPDPISALIDERRRAQFMAEGAHFETVHALLVSYAPPLRRQTKILDFIYDDDVKERIPPSERQIETFNRGREAIETLGDQLKLRRMGPFEYADPHGRPHLRDSLVNFLHFCLTGEEGGLNIPPCAMYLDAIIGGKALWGGVTPRIGQKFISCVAIHGFPHESYPFILDFLDDLPIAYRFSTRFKPMHSYEAKPELEKYKRHWEQKKRGFFTQLFRIPGGMVNEDAALMERQAASALSDAHSNLISFGYYTPVIVLMGEDRTVLEGSARAIQREIVRFGFACDIEDVNTMEAWLGSLPGHVHPNVRRPLIHSLNCADMVPVGGKWAGLDRNPSPLFPENSPPLMIAATIGATPFRLNFHVSDVGHTLIFGPTGAGKSVLLNTAAMQFRRYAGARIVGFDKGMSAFATVKGCGGDHYHLLGDDHAPGFCPLAFLDTPSDVAWAEEWLGECYELQTGVALSPKQKEEVHRAVMQMHKTGREESRSLTDFVSTVQDEHIRLALRAYTIDGPLGELLDARRDGLRDSTFTVFEIEELMSLGERNLIPVLRYLFRRFEKSLTGAPALLLLDEAWVMLGHPVFREKIREWLKVLRKANCACVLATQSLSDALRSGLFDVLLESCPSKILLPNEEANKRGTAEIPGPYDIYMGLGLTDAEIGIVASMIRKREYYYFSADGRRRFELGLGPIELAFAGVSSKAQVAEVKAVIAAHGDGWRLAWLKQQGVDYEGFQVNVA